MNTYRKAGSGWTWKPVELAILVIAFVIHWVLGLAVIGWKYWNERQATPLDVESGFREAASRMRDGFDKLFGAQGLAQGDFGPTGNAAFDAHVRERLASIEGDRRALAEEVRAFRAFVAERQAGNDDLYREFRAKRGD